MISSVEVAQGASFDFALLEKKITLEIEAKKQETSAEGADVEGVSGIADLYRPSYFHSLPWYLKRTVDFVASFLGLVVLSPLLLFIAALIKLDSPGPVFFRQQRVGWNGKPFEMLKFRTMRQDAEKILESLLQYNEVSDGMFKMKNDPRITRIGHFLRKYSLDELPQLINVLRGEMSLVGPRPPLPRELEAYKPWHYVRFSTLPGLTGLWQVSGRSEIISFDQVVHLDFTYIRHWSVLLDTKILLRTIPVVLFGKGAA